MTGGGGGTTRGGGGGGLICDLGSIRGERTSAGAAKIAGVSANRARPTNTFAPTFIS